jgi:hypothetical protein
MSRGHTTPQPEFAPLFNELLATRARYETARIADCPLIERSLLLEQLHELRHEMSLVRQARV